MRRDHPARARPRGGGDDAPAFIGRLGRLIDAAVKAPAAVDTARRRFAEVTAADAPVEKMPEERVEAYRPEAPPEELTVFHPGLRVHLVVPPGFPPSAEIVALVGEVARELEVAVHLGAITVTGRVGAIRALAPGVPTLRVGPRDVERDAELRPELGYFVRTYGNGAIVPPRELVREALLEARDQEWTISGRMHWVEQEIELKRRRTLELLGRESPARPAPPDPRRDCDLGFEAELVGYAGFSRGFEHDGFWQSGLWLAAVKLYAAAADDPRDGRALWAEIEPQIDEAVAHARALRGGDPTFDGGDPLETGAMAAAQGAAVVAHVHPAGDADERVRRAREHFDAVRALTETLLDTELDKHLKPVVLSHALERAGLPAAIHNLVDPRPGLPGLDLVQLRRSFEDAVALAVAEDQAMEAEGFELNRDWLEAELKRRSGTAKPAVDLERRLARDRARSLATHQIKRAFDEALERSGSRLEAARAALDEAARLLPEDEEGQAS